MNILTVLDFCSHKAGTIDAISGETATRKKDEAGQLQTICKEKLYYLISHKHLYHYSIFLAILKIELFFILAFSLSPNFQFFFSYIKGRKYMWDNKYLLPKINRPLKLPLYQQFSTPLCFYLSFELLGTENDLKKYLVFIHNFKLKWNMRKLNLTTSDLECKTNRKMNIFHQFKLCLIACCYWGLKHVPPHLFIFSLIVKIVFSCFQPLLIFQSFSLRLFAVDLKKINTNMVLK